MRRSFQRPGVVQDDNAASVSLPTGSLPVNTLGLFSREERDTERRSTTTHRPAHESAVGAALATPPLQRGAGRSRLLDSQTPAPRRKFLAARPMRRLTLPLCVALALFTVLAVWMFTSGDGARAAHQAVQTREHTTATRSGESTNSQMDESAPGRSAAQAVSNEHVQQSAAPRLVREVVPVTGASERRVRDAQLWWCAEPEGAPPAGHISIYERLRDCALEAHLKASARELAPDDEGRFFLEADARCGTIVALAPDLFGMLEVERGGTQPLRVALEPDLALQVRVVDMEGAPVAGVHVALRQFYNGEHFNDHGRAPTDADGVAHLPHYRALIAGDWDFTAQYALSIAEPLSPTVNHFFEVAQPPRGRVELVLPPCGSVELKLPPEGKFRKVGLEALGAGSPDESDWPSFADGWRRPEKDVVVFPFVGLELELVPATRSEFMATSHAHSRLRGPRTAGERIVAQLNPPQGLVQVRGRLLDANGAVLGAHHLYATCSTGGAEDENRIQLADLGLSTDASGEFRFEFPHSDALAFDLDLRVSTLDYVVLGAVRRTNIARRGTELDLGDVTIQRWNVIASGVVVDALGNPAPEAYVDCYEAYEERDKSGALQVEWQRSFGTSSRAGADGTFELRAPAPPGRIALIAGSDTTRSEPLECRGGASGLRLVVVEGGVLTGRISAAADTRFDYFTLQLECVEFLRPQLLGQSHFQPFLDTSGEFALRGLPEGRYVLEVHRQGFDEALAKIEDIQVRIGGSPDPRLHPLVLRERPELVEVRLVDSRDRPVSGAALLRVQQTPDGPEVEQANYTRSRVIVDRRSPPMWVVADGFAALEFDPATVGDTLRLTRAPLLRVEFAAGCELPREGVNSWILVQPLDRASELGGWLMTRLSPAATGAEAQVGFLGRVSLELWLDGENSAQVPVEVVGGGTLVATSLAQTATLKFEPSALEQALEKVGRGR